MTFEEFVEKSEAEVEDYEYEAMEAYYEEAGGDYYEEWSEFETAFRDAYAGEYDDLTEYAAEIVEQTIDLDKLPQIIRYHIDYGGIARDLSYEGYRCYNGYVFYP